MASLNLIPGRAYRVYFNSSYNTYLLRIFKESLDGWAIFYSVDNEPELYFPDSTAIDFIILFDLHSSVSSRLLKSKSKYRPLVYSKL